MTRELSGFRYPAYPALKTFLGESDAAVEVLELSRRFFLGSVPSGEDPNSWFKGQSERLGVTVAVEAAPDSEPRSVRLYIVATYTGLELYLQQLARQAKVLLKKEPWIGKDEESILTTVCGVLNLQQKLESNVTLLKVRGVAEYYRLVRNATVHAGKKPPTVPKAGHEVGKAYRLRAPSDFHNLGFDDFVLFTRVAKDLASALSSALCPTVAQLAESVNTDLLKRFENNPLRWTGAAATALRTKWGLSESSADIVAKKAAAKHGLLDQG